jgi:hypothetical protein
VHVLTACWSVKGGSGTTVVAATLALLSARAGLPGALFADLDGEAPAVLGLREPDGPGLGDWLAVDGHPAEALDRLEVEVGPGLSLLPRGRAGPGGDAAGRALGVALLEDPRAVVADCGLLPDGARAAVVEVATCSLLVMRPCYLAVRRAAAASLRPHGIVLVQERGRALTARDLEDVVGVPVLAEVEVDPAVARSVDAGLLSSRLPRLLQRGLRGVA